ncbi:MAG: hypothetical protein JO091_04465 [Acidobacteriaceae bacterium]|nr:hypothetical protein [Acidobacteriaceae bacterium]
MPQLHRGECPWEYPGRLLFYVQQCEMALNGENSRSRYYFRTRAAGRLLAEPIPQIHFGHSGKAVERSGEPVVLQVSEPESRPELEPELVFKPIESTAAPVNQLSQERVQQLSLF